ncbi:hypothetical protein POF53_10180 [Mitsuaria sp. RG]|nr:hypothetical protein [Mitsuaria sp. RG]
MSTEKKSVVTEKTAFEYNALGQVARTCSDESDTHSYYYLKPSTAGGGGTDKSVPDLNGLLNKFKMADGTALLDALQFCCPSIPDTRQPPLLGLLQLFRAPNGSALSAKMTLFGYHLVTLDSKGILIPNTVLTLENIAVDPKTSPWTVSKMKDGEGLRITLQQSTRALDHSGSQQTVTTWYNDNSTRLTHALNETFSHHAASNTHLSCTTTHLVEEGVELQPVLSQQVRSALSGLLLRESHQDELGRPVSQFHHLYDIRGRQNGNYITAYDATTFTEGVNSQATDLGVRREETGNGTWVTVTGPDGRCGRTLYDGLQRPVRHELQRYPGADQTAHNYCLLHETHYDACGNIVEQNLYDYLPGGLRRRQRNLQLPNNLKDWFWHGKSSSTTTDSTGNTTQVTENSLGSINQKTHSTVRQSLTSYADGQFSLHQQRWSSHGAEKTAQGIDSKKKIDAFGRVLELTEVVPSADETGSQPTTRLWRMEYDALNRKTKQHCPGDMTIEYDYQGYATSPVKLTVRQGKEVRVIGSRTLKEKGLKGEQVLTMTRGNAATEGGLTYKYQEQCTVLPDSSKIVKELNADGESVDYFTEYPCEAGKTPRRTLLFSFKRAPIAHAISKERHAFGEHQGYNTELTTSAAVVGTHSIRQQTRGASLRHTVHSSLRGEIEHVRLASGVHKQIWRNANGQVRRVQRAGMEYLYEYTTLGEIKRVQVKGSSADHDLEMNSTYDAFGYESSREYRLAGETVVRHERVWSPTGQLTSKSIYRDGGTTPSSTQTYKYDAVRGWLTGWSIDAKDGDKVLDSSGNVLSSQSYQYDLIANLTQCRSERADGTTEIRDYTYHTHYSTRRESVSITLLDRAGKQISQSKVQLGYDANGNLSVNERGQNQSYTPTGRLASVSDASGLLTTYEYDADDRLIGQWDHVRKQRHVLAYSGDRLCMEIVQDKRGTIIKRRILDEETGLLAQVFDSSDSDTNGRMLFNLLDPQDGSGDQYHLAEDGQWVRAGITFSPWGETCLEQFDNIEGIGYNGQRVDPITGCYHLGNGYRSYAPSEKHFQQPDDWSPFGLGGLNDRGYCSGDPVNWQDPSGHFMISRQGAASQLASLDEMIRKTAPPVHERAAWWEWVLLGVFVVIGVVTALMTGGAMAVFLLTLLVVSTALDIASMATRHTNPRLSKTLGYAALAVGLADLAKTGIKKLGQGLVWLARQTKQIKAAIKFNGLSNAFRRLGSRGDNLDKLHNIGSSASKSRTANAVNQVDHMFDLGSAAGDVNHLLENPLGITTWAGQQRLFTPLNVNPHGPGNLHAIVEQSRIGNTVASNVAEIEDMKKISDEINKLTKTLGGTQALGEDAALISMEVKEMQGINLRATAEHHNFCALKQQHNQAFEQVATLKGAHEELVGLRTQHSEFFFRNSEKQAFGRRLSATSAMADDKEMMAIARPDSHKAMQGELVEFMDTLEQSSAIATEIRTATSRLESLAITDLRNTPYKIISPHTGEELRQSQLLDNYFKTTLTSDAAATLRQHKTDHLLSLAKLIGDGNDVALILNKAKNTPGISHHDLYTRIHHELINSCARRHALAVSELQELNKKLLLKANVLQEVFDHQIASFNRYRSAARRWSAKAFELEPKGASTASLHKIGSFEPKITMPSLKLKVFGHTANVSAPGDKARYMIRVESSIEKRAAHKLLHDTSPETSASHALEPKVHSEYWDGHDLNDRLIRSNLDPKHFDEIELVMCDSATGGNSSIMRELHASSGTPIKGYEGSVTSTGFIESAGTWDLVPDSRNPGCFTSELVEKLGNRNNAGFFPIVEMHYENSLSHYDSIIKTRSITHTNYQKAQNTYLTHKLAINDLGPKGPQIVANLEHKADTLHNELTYLTMTQDAALMEAGREAGRNASSVYLSVLKSNKPYSNYRPKRIP